jgi:glycerol kinase
VIRVTETLMPGHRYADARYGLVGGPPKTQAGDRDIPIPGWLCDQLAAMLAERADGKPGGVRSARARR